MGKFVKGQSGNPGGRPKAEREVLEVARQHGPAAIAKLVDLSMSADERTALAACNSLLDRAYGKPKQSQEISGPDGAPIVTRVELVPLSGKRTG